MTTVQTRPRRGRTAALVATPPRTVALVVLAGAAVSVQAWLNGRLGERMGSVMTSAAINHVVAAAATLAVVLATGALPRGLARMRAGVRPPAWCFAGGLAGALVVAVTAAAAPVVGVALVTVAIVCGSTLGSLPVDAAGLGPAGRRPITAPRLAGVVLAIVATAVGALGVHGELDPWLLALAVVGGVAIAGQAAANGRLAQATGEPFLAALINTALGLAVLFVVGAVVIAQHPPDAFPGNPLLYLGGLCGAFVVVVSAAAVQTLGVLRLGLATVAGQTIGALVMDLVAPAPDKAVTAGTVLGVALTLLAVWISGRGRRSPAG